MNDFQLQFPGGQVAGPYTLEEVRAFLNARQVDFGTMFWRPGMKGWRPLGSIRATLIGQTFDVSASPGITLHTEPSPHTRGIYIILGILLGTMGAHNFYAGHLGRGTGQLALTVVSIACVFLFSPAVASVVSLVVLVWILAELCTERLDGRGRVLQ
jgi:TM2 domain-containing membrane protein YozV